MQYIMNNENDFLPTFLLKSYFLLSFFYFILIFEKLIPYRYYSYYR